MVNKTEEENLVEIKKQIKQVLAEEKNMPPEAASLIEENLTKMIKEDLSLTEALGFTPDMLEEIYQEAYLFFQSGKFKEALPIFQLLRRLDGLDSRFTFAIAACNHQMKNYEEAVGNYIICEGMDPTNPFPYYHMYDCFKKMNQPELAINALKAAYQIIADDPKYAEMKGKIELELQRFETEKK